MDNEKIKAWLVQNKQSINWLSKSTGISSGLVNQYVNGKNVPGLDNAIKIADAMDVSIDWLCGRTENPKINR